jgi:hypothetical protein
MKPAFLVKARRRKGFGKTGRYNLFEKSAATDSC